MVLDNLRSLSVTVHTYAVAWGPRMVIGAPATGGLSRGSGRLSRRGSWGHLRLGAGRREHQSGPPEGAVRAACAGPAEHTVTEGVKCGRDTRKYFLKTDFSDYKSNSQLIKIQKSVRERVGPTRQLPFT